MEGKTSHGCMICVYSRVSTYMCAYIYLVKVKAEILLGKQSTSTLLVVTSQTAAGRSIQFKII